MRKKIAQTIKLRSFKSQIERTGIDLFSDSYFVLFRDGTYVFCADKTDLVRALENDHIKPVKYVVQRNDLIYLDRDILVDIDEVS
jgi:hypothetical protein